MVYSFADSAEVFESFDDGDTAHHNGCVWFTKGFVGEEAAEVPGIVSIRGTDSTEGALYRTGANGSAYSLRFVYDHPNSGLQPKTQVATRIANVTIRGDSVPSMGFWDFRNLKGISFHIRAQGDESIIGCALKSPFAASGNFVAEEGSKLQVAYTGQWEQHRLYWGDHATQFTDMPELFGVEQLVFTFEPAQADGRPWQGQIWIDDVVLIYWH